MKKHEKGTFKNISEWYNAMNLCFQCCDSINWNGTEFEVIHRNKSNLNAVFDTEEDTIFRKLNGQMKKSALK